MMLIHMAHSDIPRGSLNMCCRWAEIGPKAPQEAQSNPQKPISVSLKVTLLTFMYRQMVFCCSLEPLSRWPGCGFCCTSKKWAMGKLSGGHIEVICQSLTFLQQSVPIQCEGSLHPSLGWTAWHKPTPLFSIWKRESPVFTGNTFLPTTTKRIYTQSISWFCYEFINIGNCSFKLQEQKDTSLQVTTNFGLVTWI